MNVIIIVVCAAIIGLGSVFITKKKDNPVEEAAEVVIEKELNLPEGSVDLTPGDDKK
jgi:hypothetical protein